MVTDKIKELEAARAKLATLEQSIADELNKELGGLPAKYGFASAADWEITGNLTARLRAERTGGGSGRTYTLTIKTRDAAGNVTTGTATVFVPHDRR